MSTATRFDVRSKPTEEFGRIFEEHYDLIYRTAYSITRSAEDAEDVVQSIFLQLLRREVLPDLAKNPKGYFYRSAVNLSLRTIRSRKRHILTNDNERFESIAAEAPEDEEMDRRLWAAIAEIGETSAQIVILRYIHEYSQADIAKLLGTSRSTVAVSLFRSRARLKRIIRASQTGVGS